MARTTQTWNTAAYSTSGRFVADLAGEVLNLLAAQPGERILDLGCGDGAITAQLAAIGVLVTGVDASPEMAAAARTRGLEIEILDAQALPYVGNFDAVFSNAALHWMPDVTAVLEGVFRALHPGGRFVAEMGGHGNIAAIRTALRAVLAPYGVDAETAAGSFFPSAERYRVLLEQAGFTVHGIGLMPRPTPLPGGADGMSIWLSTFRNGVLDLISAEDRASAVEQIVALLKPILADAEGCWTADYVRLRFHATK